MHAPFKSRAGLGGHLRTHRRDARPVHPERVLDRGEREYVRKRLMYAAGVLASELRCSAASIVAVIPGVLKERRRDLRVDPEDIPMTDGVLRGVKISPR